MKEPFIFFGTPSLAAETLHMLIEEGFIPTLVVTNPDRPQGRGLTLTPTPVRVLAEEYAIPVLTPEKIDNAELLKIRGYMPSYAIVVAYGKILSRELITMFPKGILNVHYSLLPKYRGATPLESALRAGDTETGVTIQRMDFALDAGDIIAQDKVPIEPASTARALRKELTVRGAKLLITTLPTYLSGTMTLTPQNDTDATYCGKIQKTDGELILTPENAVQNWLTYRAFNDTIGTFFFTEHKGRTIRVKINEAVYNGTTFTPTRVTPEGKREMDYTTFISTKHS